MDFLAQFKPYTDGPQANRPPNARAKQAPSAALDQSEKDMIDCEMGWVAVCSMATSSDVVRGCHCNPSMLIRQIMLRRFVTARVAAALGRVDLW